MDHNIPKNELMAQAEKAGNSAMRWILAATLLVVVAGIVSARTDMVWLTAGTIFASGFSLGVAFCSFQACVGLEFEARKIDGDGRP